MKFKKLITSGLVLVALTTPYTGCSSSKPHKNSSTQTNQTSLTTKSQKYSRLEDKYKTLESKNTEIETDYARLERNNLNLRRDLERKKTAYEKLKEDNVSRKEYLELKIKLENEMTNHLETRANHAFQKRRAKEFEGKLENLEESKK